MAKLTTAKLRAQHPLGDLLERAAAVGATRWRPTAVEILSVHGGADLLDGRAYHRVVTVWSWERGPDFNRTFELVDAAAAGFRMDGSHAWVVEAETFKRLTSPLTVGGQGATA